ncbi:hypothetical protein GCM10027321_16970 [Massilia terrae]|uniref:Uncharacterized protein n=1 Tax=Massilia terrae TaxID=1811224 RepID=A0ABT2CWL5_9BURK|nr:hypothetical protein [Massilia terrae]MCS0658234.1 hypothetical protein [Massilia terrae]
MRRSALFSAAGFALLAACSTPYNAPVVVHDSAPFPGIAGAIAQDSTRQVDVVLVHGMCSHDTSWAKDAMDNITKTIRTNTEPQEQSLAAGPSPIQVVERSDKAAGGMVHFHSLVWSPLSAALKQQLDYDNTGSSTDCSKTGECKPKRARYNGKLKDSLLNDCLSDAMIYQGQSNAVMKQAMIAAVSGVLERAEKRPDTAPLIVVAESLGSKLLFDALSDMLQPDAPGRMHELGQAAARRMALVFMVGNQLPILGLAEQQVTPSVAPAGPPDSLQRFLTLRRMAAQTPKRSESLSKLAVVAFTDPNDLLSYRLMPSRYAGPDVVVADVLVSNSSTWFGLLEDPFAAHLNYMQNKDVGAMIACGWPRSKVCN